MKAWSETVNIEKLNDYFKNWHSKQELVEEYNFSNIQSWHCLKYLVNVKRYLTKRKGRQILYKKREFY